MDDAAKIRSIGAHVGRVLQRLERTSFRDGLERTLLMEQLENVLATVPASSAARRRERARRSGQRLLREAVNAAQRVGSSLAQLRALEPDADEWRPTLGELKEEIATLLATEEDRLGAEEVLEASA